MIPHRNVGFSFMVYIYNKNNNIMARRIQLSETELTRLIKRVIIQEQTGGNVTHAMIQQCKHLLNNVQGTNAAWKQNFKARVLGKSVEWIRNKMVHFGNKMNTAQTGSGAYNRARARSHFLECLIQELY